MLKQSNEAYRISPPQRRLWILQSEDNHADRSTHAVVRIEGPLEIERLKQAVASVTLRHEALRTTVQRMPGISLPVQVVNDGSVKTETLIEEAGSWNYDDYRRAPLPQIIPPGAALGARLFQVGDISHILFLQAPAICADATSMSIIADEICELYRTQGEAQNLDAPLQYPDVSEWLNAVCSSEDENAISGRQYWEQKLSGIETCLSELLSCSPDVIDIVLDSGVVAVVTAGVEKNLWTYPGFFLAAWTALLERFDLAAASCMAVACDGRSHEMLRNTVGPLTQHLPVALPLDQALPFNDAAAKASIAVNEASGWQEFFHWELSPKQSSAEKQFLYLPFSFEYISVGGCKGDPCNTAFKIETLSGSADRYDIHLCCVMNETGVQCRVLWDKAKYETEQIRRIAAALKTIVADAATNPQAAIKRLKITGTDERKLLLEAFNRTVHEFPKQEFFLHEGFTAQATRTPNAEAVRFNGQSLNYCQLDQRANQVAAWLRSRGIGPESLVGVCLERSFEMVIALLGVLKAGAAYVPLDPGYPPERLEFMLRDSNAAQVITTPSIAQKMNFTAEAVTIEQMCAGPVAESIVTPVEDKHPAYVIYTSGSTGVPKGVMISHQAIANHMAWMADEFPLTPQDKVLQKTAFSFDASVWEFYAPLLAGACLVMAQPGGQQDREYLVQCLREEQITVLQLVPSQLQMLLEDEKLKNCTALKRVFCGGEALSSDLVRHLHRYLPQAGLYNLYGPTEATIDATCGKCSPEDLSVNATIGAPVANTQVFLLDEEYEPVPQGVKGELFIGGAGLARGYINRADLTADRFVPHPFPGLEGERLYRTGDLARWRDDQTLEFAGRKDHQVKVRGYRIELAEIEAALLEHPALSQACVIVREDNPGDKRLVAYIVSQPDAAIEREALTTHLHRKLPEYMVPSAFVQLDSFPLMPNGKVDRKALPVPERCGPERISSAPLKAEEELICGIFAEVLGLAQIDAKESFFELGGHSLMATQVISRIRSAFQVDLPVRVLFESPSASEMTERIREARGLPSEASLQVTRADRNSRLPLSFAQQRLWVIDQLDPGSAAYNIHYGLKLRGNLNTPALWRAINEIVRRHEILRTSFPTVQGEAVQHIAPQAELEPREFDLSRLEPQAQETEVNQLSRAEAGKPIDLSAGPVIRACLLRLSDHEHVLLITLHHIVSDGWSLGIMVRELTSVYEAYIKGGPSPLPPLEFQYADFAVTQKQWLSGEAMERQLAYWRKQLNGFKLLQLPPDFPGTANPGNAGGSVTVEISPEMTAKLKEAVRHENVTLFMSLLAAYQIVLGNHAKQDDVTVGADIANRNWSETESMIGFFVNQLVLRTGLEGDPTWRELLGRVRKTVLEAYEYQDLPFEKLVAEIAPERSLGNSPLFSSKLVFQNMPRSSFQLQGLEIEFISSQIETSKFDLTLTLQEAAGAIAGTFVYKSGLFKPETIELFRIQLISVLELALENPEVRLGALKAKLLSIAREQVNHQKQEIDRLFRNKLESRRRKAAV